MLRKVERRVRTVLERRKKKEKKQKNKIKTKKNYNATTREVLKQNKNYHDGSKEQKNIHYYQ